MNRFALVESRALSPRVPAGSTRPLRLRAVTLLSGSVRSQNFSAALGRSLLDLPVEDRRSVLGLWMDGAAAVGRRYDLPALSVRVLVDRTAPLPVGNAPSGVSLQIERDPLQLRGTGGLLRDIARQYEDEDYILAAPAAQVLLTPLDSLVAQLAERGDDVALIANDDGMPSSLFLLRCGALRAVSPVGYCDLKEQALAAIGRRHRVRVIHRPHAAALPVRTREDYIAAVRTLHRMRLEQPPTVSAFAEDWRAAFRIIEPGAQVDAGACVLDSVVLAGGKVGRGAVVARSIIGPRGIVGREQKVIDRLVGCD